jgi:hypothetical protein
MTSLIALYSKFYIGLMAFLLMLFPNSGSLQYNYLVQTNHTNIAAPKIISAMKAKDIDALEELMCRNIKDNVNNLSVEISKLMDSIDGEIINSSWENIGDYNENRGNGKAILQVNLVICLSTSMNTYHLGVMWETANSFAKEEAGIRNIGLSVDSHTLVLITATEGVGEWHD